MGVVPSGLAAIIAGTVVWSTTELAAVSAMTAAASAAVTATIIVSSRKVRSRLTSNLQRSQLISDSHNIPQHLYDSMFQFCKESQHEFVSPNSMLRCAKHASNAMGLNRPEIAAISEEAAALWQGADFDSDGLLSPSEWESASYGLSTIFGDVLLSIFDVNDDGGLSEEEWQLFVQATANGLAEIGQRPPSGLLSSLEHAFSHHQVDGNGLLAQGTEIIRLVLEGFQLFYNVLS